MNLVDRKFSRRQLLALFGGLSASLFTPMGWASRLRERAIPKSGEQLPVVGMGTWQTFSLARRESAAAVLSKFVELGGRLIDTSPMYGDAEEAIGVIAKDLGVLDKLTLATKVWTRGKQAGRIQLEQSRGYMGKQIDIAQIHNLLDWRSHLPTLREFKEKGLIRYIGITHYTVAAHEELERIIRQEPIDFVQVNYNIAVRDAERRLLPTAAEQDVAVIINRPYAGGSLFRQARGNSLPPWAAEFDCQSLGQFFLKYILSNPHVTCAIPATSKVHHMEDNMGAARGALPDKKTRARMVEWFETL